VGRGEGTKSKQIISQPGGAEFSDQRAKAPRLCASGNFGSGYAGLGFNLGNKADIEVASVSGQKARFYWGLMRVLQNFGDEVVQSKIHVLPTLQKIRRPQLVSLIFAAITTSPQLDSNAEQSRSAVSLARSCIWN